MNSAPLTPRACFGKLRGGWTLQHTDGRRWLLIKRRDEEADARRNPVSTQPESVISGRDENDSTTGDVRNDYNCANNYPPSAQNGFAPDSRNILQIRVNARTGPADPPITLPAAFTPTDPFLVTQTPGVRKPVSP